MAQAVNPYGCSISYHDFKHFTKNKKIHRLPQVSRVVVTRCVYGGFSIFSQPLNSRPNHSTEIHHKHKEYKSRYKFCILQFVQIWKITFLSRKFFPQNGRKLESVENIVRDIFILCLVFNKTIIPLTLVGYELMIADSVLRTSSAI